LQEKKGSSQLERKERLGERRRIKKGRTQTRTLGMNSCRRVTAKRKVRFGLEWRRRAGNVSNKPSNPALPRCKGLDAGDHPTEEHEGVQVREEETKRERTMRRSRREGSSVRSGTREGVRTKI